MSELKIATLPTSDASAATASRILMFSVFITTYCKLYISKYTIFTLQNIKKLPLLPSAKEAMTTYL